ncbi:MAG TPA: SDR family oxidoreductase [Casimicrobiaceae bacterium]|nr:SDR family oxidoreductase [Casimicrobiaceae bacterium]
MSEPLMPGRAVYPTLKNRVVVITGGASGIGRSMVEHFCDQGSRVSFVDIQDDAATELAESVAARGNPKPTYRRCDVRDVGALKDAIDAIGRESGPVKVLLNNAGNDDRHRLEDVTSSYFDDRIALNLKHQLFAVQAVRPQMRDSGGGSIINLNSIIWTVADGDCVCYVTAKSAVTGLTRALATELGPEKIRVNGIAPGWVMTERQIKLWLTPDGERRIEERQALKDRLFPPDIARMALWLAADDSRMCTKQTFVVDGGWI